MRAILRGLAGENSETLRGLTGQGEPGLWALLGGTSQELDAEGYTLGGGVGQVSATSRLSRASRDTYLAGIASGVGYTPPGGSPPPGGTTPPQVEK